MSRPACPQRRPALDVSAYVVETLALQTARGLKAATLAEARKLNAESMQIKPTLIPNPEAQKAAREEAEKQMWAWYLEWSAIAQRVIANRRHLRAMGYRLGPKGAPGPVVEDDFSDDADEEAEDELDFDDETSNELEADEEARDDGEVA